MSQPSAFRDALLETFGEDVFLRANELAQVGGEIVQRHRLRGSVGPADDGRGGEIAEGITDLMAAVAEWKPIATFEEAMAFWERHGASMGEPRYAQYIGHVRRVVGAVNAAGGAAGATSADVLAAVLALGAWMLGEMPEGFTHVR